MRASFASYSRVVLCWGVGSADKTPRYYECFWGGGRETNDKSETRGGEMRREGTEYYGRREDEATKQPQAEK